MPESVANLAAIRARIIAAARAAGRDPAGVRLVVVSKTHPAEAVLPLLAAGQRLFGESRVQEAVGKWTALKAAHPDVELHMIGPLQTNKVREAVTLFDAIHGVDRAKLARSLAHEMARQGRRPRCLIQVNTGREAQKAGIDPDQADRFIAACRDDFGLPVAGVMCIPPADADPEPHFRLLAAIAERHGLEMISMGMSGDFEQAIAAGATHVRVGSAILGER